ncbi:MAG: glycosyltransferase family 39 protein [Anaerolineae bacterium]|nr:glycosyltransferase family 39 protein [Anaerolineae bacterium]
MNALRILASAKQRRDWLHAFAPATLAAILAAVPRLYRLNLAEFRLDEANHYRMAYFLTRGDWRWVGSTSSIGFPKPPLFVYALSLPLAISGDPRIATGFLGILAALAAGTFYLVLHRFWSKRAASCAALLFAFTPQAILHARKLFTADLLPPLCTLFLAAGIAYLKSKPKHAGRLAACATFAFALLLMTTFSPLLLLPTLGLLLLERRRDLRPRHWIVAAAALALPFGPYLIAAQDRIPAALAGAGSPPTPVSPGTLLDWIWGLSGAPQPENIVSIAGLATVLWAVLSLVGLVFLVKQARKRHEGGPARFLLSWLCLPTLLTFVAPVEIQPHYLVILYPPLFALPAAGIELLSRQARAWARAVRVLSWVALLFLTVTAVWQARDWADALPEKIAPQASLGYRWRVAERTRLLVAREGAAEALLLLPDDSLWSEEANVLDALLSDTPHRLVDGSVATVYPHHAAVLTIAPEVEAAASIARPCTQDLGGDGYAYRLWDPAGASAAACADDLLPAEAQWASGVRLLGYGVSGSPRPGETLHIVLHVETTQGPLEADVHWFNQLEDQGGQRWGQFDHAGWPAERWQPGERVLLHFDLPIAEDAAPGPYILRVGQYVYHSPENIENVPVVDVAGNPADYAVALPIPE